VWSSGGICRVRRGSDKSLAFPISYFPICNITKRIFLDGLKELEKGSHKCVELRGELVEQIHFLNPVACCFLYKVKDLSAPLYIQPTDIPPGQ
jgi:hypothetical protein